MSVPSATTAAATPVTWLALLLALRGTVFLYQGEELGLPQSTIAFEDLRDPYGLANWPQNPGRDGCRTPFPWRAAAPHHGFSTASRTWLPVDPAHAPLAVDRQLEDPASTLHAARRLLALRREHVALRLGDLEVLVAEGDVLVLRRQCAGKDMANKARLNAGDANSADANTGDALLLAFNLGTTAAMVPLHVGLAIANGHTPLFAHAGAEMKGTHLHLPPGGALYASVT